MLRKLQTREDFLLFYEDADFIMSYCPKTALSWNNLWSVFVYLGQEHVLFENLKPSRKADVKNLSVKLSLLRFIRWLHAFYFLHLGLSCFLVTENPAIKSVLKRLGFSNADCEVQFVKHHFKNKEDRK